MVLLPVISYMSGERFIYKIFSFFAMLGLFISIGLIIDSQTMLFKFITIYANEDLANIDETILSQGRCSFLSESVSTFGVSFSFCVLSSIIMY